jgi:tRNA threonylcarbamoyladenosine biosynthesis protein TsaE
MRLTFDEVALVQFGQRLAGDLAPGDCLTLQGPLGAGKSTLARAIIQQLTHEEEVPSPTFTLVQMYEAPGFTLWHYDLYRLEHPSELAELAIDEALGQGVCLIEWPEIALPFLPSGRLAVRLSPGDTETSRTIELEGPSRWQQRWPHWILPA